MTLPSIAVIKLHLLDLRSIIVREILKENKSMFFVVHIIKEIKHNFLLLEKIYLVFFSLVYT